MWRTTPVHRWEITGSPERDAAPELPGEMNLAGVKRIADGAGPLLHRIYRTRVVGGNVGAEGLIEKIAANLDCLAPWGFASFQKLEGEGPLAVGDDYVVRMPGPWDGPVRAVEVRPDSFRLATLTDHLEAGQIEFRARSDHRSVEFTIESWARSGDRLSDFMYTRLRVGKEVQLHMWTSVLERVVELAGGVMEGGITTTTRRVEQAWLGNEPPPPLSRRRQRRLAELAQREVNFDASRMGDYTRSTGWHVDDMVEPLPHEPPGPPTDGGVWQLARRLVIEYQLAEPNVVDAVYLPDAPLEGRNMLLMIRFHGLRFAVGVRVGEVYEGDREVGGRRARVFGWAYRTLEGHFEQGEMHYEVWKWLDSGDVEFRLHAVSKVADRGPWVLRVGFRLVGRLQQLRFYRQTCRRVRRLTDAELETRRAAGKT
jgi:uncharacterized protein (UPF0548 family)